MSSKNNVNPDHYKVAGRDRVDDKVRARRETPPTGKSHRKKGDSASNFIPGATKANEAAEDEESGGAAKRR
jgi:hypothetical protein